MGTTDNVYAEQYIEVLNTNSMCGLMNRINSLEENIPAMTDNTANTAEYKNLWGFDDEFDPWLESEVGGSHDSAARQLIDLSIKRTSAELTTPNTGTVWALNKWAFRDISRPYENLNTHYSDIESPNFFVKFTYIKDAWNTGASYGRIDEKPTSGISIGYVSHHHTYAETVVSNEPKNEQTWSDYARLAAKEDSLFVYDPDYKTLTRYDVGDEDDNSVVTETWSISPTVTQSVFGAIGYYINTITDSAGDPVSYEERIYVLVNSAGTKECIIYDLDGVEQDSFEVGEIDGAATCYISVYNDEIYVQGDDPREIYIYDLEGSLDRTYNMPDEEEDVIDNISVCNKGIYFGRGLIALTGFTYVTARGSASPYWIVEGNYHRADCFGDVAIGIVRYVSAGSGDFEPLGQTSRSWRDVATASNGDIYACVSSGDIYKQTNGEGDFEPLGQTSRSWFGMTTASNGDIYACVSGGDIYKQSSGEGDFIALGQTSRSWFGMTTASNGDIYACVYFNDIYKQTNGEGDFEPFVQVHQTWRGVAAAPNGDIYACVQSGDIYKQTGGTGDFIALGQTSRSWLGMTTASNGDIYACVSGGDIYKQSSGEGDFEPLSQTSRNWYGITTIPNGSLYACVVGGDIYKQTGIVNGIRIAAIDLNGYLTEWQAYRSGDSPRRKSIGLYPDLGALATAYAGGADFVVNTITQMRDAILGILSSFEKKLFEYSDFSALSQTSRSWYGITAAPNKDIYACVSNGDIYKQTDGEGDFIALGQTSRNWYDVAAALNGDVYACVYNGDIYVQTDSTGDFIALSQTSRAWVGMTAAPNGDVYASAYNGDIYKQTGGTGDFIALGQTSRYWTKMASNVNEDVYACVYNNGDIYKQTGGTGDFIALGQTSRYWWGLTATSYGDIFACVYGGDVYKQTGGKDDFDPLSLVSRNWTGMASNGDGDVYACVSGGDIYKSLMSIIGGYPYTWEEVESGDEELNLYYEAMCDPETIKRVNNYGGLTEEQYDWTRAEDTLPDSWFDEDRDWNPHGDDGDIYKMSGGTDDFNLLDQTTRDWSGLAGDPNGDVFACVNLGAIYLQTEGDSDQDFIEFDSAVRSYSDMCAAPNGDIYACETGLVDGGYIYRLENGGSTFSQVGTTYQVWTGITATSDGDIYACAEGDDIYMLDSSDEFTALGDTTRDWSGITAHNNEVYACVDGGDIYKMDDGGTFQPLLQTSRSWSAMCSSGLDVYACVDSGDVYVQYDGIGDFEPLDQTSRQWSGMTVASNGNVYACVDGGDIYMRIREDLFFGSLEQTNRRWDDTASDSDGNVYACVYAGGIYKQTGGVGDFISLEQEYRYWYGITVDPTTDEVYACVDEGDIYLLGSSGDFEPLGQTERRWRGMCATPGGDVYACVDGVGVTEEDSESEGGDIYQMDGAGDFIALEQTARFWSSLAAAPNGDVYACEYKEFDYSDSAGYSEIFGGDIYKQTGGAGNFIAMDQELRYWSGITVDPDGEVYACTYAAGNDSNRDLIKGDIYKLIEGEFLSLQQTLRNWRGISAAPDGDIYVAVFGYIYDTEDFEEGYYDLQYYGYEQESDGSWYLPSDAIGPTLDENVLCDIDIGEVKECVEVLEDAVKWDYLPPVEEESV